MERETLTKEQIESLVSTGKIIDEEEVVESLTSLKAKAKEAKIKGYTTMTREELEESLKDKK